MGRFFRVLVLYFKFRCLGKSLEIYVEGGWVKFFLYCLGFGRIRSYEGLVKMFREIFFFSRKRFF